MWTSIEKLSFLDSKKKLNNEYGIFPCAKNIFFILEQNGKKFGQCVVGENKIFIALYTIIFIKKMNQTIHVSRSYLERLNPFLEDRKCIEISD